MGEKIIIDYDLCSSVHHDTLTIYKYKGEYLLFIKELSDDAEEMRFCDKNGIIKEDSPVVIVKIFNQQKDYGDVIDLSESQAVY